MTPRMTPKVWLEVRVPVTPETEESILNFLFELGSLGNHQQKNAVVAYFANPREAEKIEGALTSYLGQLAALGFAVPTKRIQTRILPDEDWNSLWKKDLRPIRISERLLIKPSWIADSENAEIVIEIDPKQAFGTGSHSTTQMALRLIERFLKPGDRVLDVGTGTGLLAIAAIKLGAERVIAVDIDPVAVEAALENVQKNRTAHKTQLLTADFSAMGRSTPRFDVILANINRREIVRSLPNFEDQLATGGHLIVTGILESEQNQFMQSLGKSLSLNPIATITDEEWLALVFRKEHSI